jgi:hypothetical protein
MFTAARKAGANRTRCIVPEPTDCSDGTNLPAAHQNFSVVFSSFVSKGPTVYLHNTSYSSPSFGPSHVAEQLKPQPYSKVPEATSSPPFLRILYSGSFG